MKTYFTLAAAAVLSLTSATHIQDHCQVPCGIYSDDTVLIDLQTHQKTIEKAMGQITDSATNANQLTRWVTNKEEHATKIQTTMVQYFLAQRIKLDEADKEAYMTKLTLAHEIIVHAMKCKQTTDVENAKKLKASIDAFTAAYNKK